MRIVINGRSILLSRRTGIGRYTYHLLDGLGKIDHVNEYIIYASRRFLDFNRRPPDFSRYRNVKNNIDVWGRGTGRSDVYHMPSPDALGPYSGALVVTIHDLVYKAWPQAHTRQTIELTDKYMKEMLPRAERVICVSNNTRRDLHRFFDLPEAKSCVVYNGVDHQNFSPLSSQERLGAVQALKALGINGPFILFVGTIEPRKNLRAVLDGFASIKSKKIFDGQLVIAGMKGWMEQDIGEFAQKLGITRDIIFTGFVTDASLRVLYGMTQALVFPSFYEGFGFTILEAFSCGTAVITSNTSACDEIAAEAALKVDPNDTAMLSRAMERVLTDQALRESLQQAAIKRSGEFSFEKMAQDTLDVYRQAAGRK